MDTKVEMVTIPSDEYDELRERDQFLDALEVAGVDNWEGYDMAMDYFRENND